MSEEDIESPYCEVCGTCGYIGCCGIRNFIEEHVEGKTNCKNEGIIINELINLCEYKDEVFEENKRLHSIIKEVREYIEEKEKDDDNWIEYEMLIEPIRIKEILERENNDTRNI